MPGSAAGSRNAVHNPGAARLVALVAGETSGDQLGGLLIKALRARRSDINFVGVAGPQMRAAGCRALHDVEALSVMGVMEVLTHLPRLVRIRRRLVAEIKALRPDLVIGIDSPDFNLGLERRLRARGIRTAHYVSPSVWAWRSGRVRTVARAAEAVFCLLPFEPDCYAGQPVRAVFTGHPLADELKPSPREDARAALGLAPGGQVLALLPGSRASEVERLTPPFVAAAAELAAGRPELHVLIPVARPSLRAWIEAEVARHRIPATLVDGRARTVISAADAVLVASGTATLETLLLNRPMVTAYQVSPLTAWLLRRTRALHTPHYALPNLLAGREIVPELIQEEVSVARITSTLAPLLDDIAERERQCAAFVAVRNVLGEDAAGRAAAAVLDLLEERSPREA